MKTLKKNEEIKGKIVTFSSFRELLLGELNKNFPTEYDEYVKIRQSTAVEMGVEPVVGPGPGAGVEMNSAELVVKNEEL